MKNLIVLLAMMLASFSAFAQTLTRSQMQSYNNANITTNGEGAITGSIINNMNGQFINGMGVLNDTNLWPGKNTFSGPLNLVGVNAALVSPPAGCPEIYLASGQSNKLGYDPGGSKTVQSGIYILNAVSTAGNQQTPKTPTGAVPAAFGTAPLNQGIGGVTTDPSVAYNNSEIWLANQRKLSGLATGRNVLVILNTFPGQSISNWVGATPGGFDPTAQYWVALQNALALITNPAGLTASDGQVIIPAGQTCYLTGIDWDQGEADSYIAATGYNTTATYAQGLSTLITQFEGLSVFNKNPANGPVTLITLQELAKWGDNYKGNARNDAIDAYLGGALDPYVDVVAVDDLTGPTCESVVNPGPHFTGACLQTIGRKLFDLSLHARIGGSFGDQAHLTVPWGGTKSYPNIISGPVSTAATCSIALTVMTCGVPTSGTIAYGQAILNANSSVGTIQAQLTGTPGGAGTYQVNPSQTLGSTALTFGLMLGPGDIANGAVIDANGGTIAMPQPYIFSGRPVSVIFHAGPATRVDFAIETGSAFDTLLGTSVTACIVQTAWMQVINVNGTWYCITLYPRNGAVARQTLNISGSTSSPNTVNGQFTNWITNNTAVTVTPVPGGSFVISNSSTTTNSSVTLPSASFSAGKTIIGPDGAVLTGGSYPILPGAAVYGEFDDSNNMRIMMDSGAVGGVNGLTRRAFTVAGLPTCTTANMWTDRSVFVSDASAAPVFDATPAGGGTVHTPVYCRNGAWHYGG